MAKNTPTGASARKSKWFARRQVYLRAGQDSQYVELSPALQIGVALGFCALALWLIGASYSAVTTIFGEDKEIALLAQLGNTEQALEDAGRTRDAEAARITALENELAGAREAAADATGSDQTLALTTELEETQAQLEELHLRLSQSKADQAALQARFEAGELAASDESKTAEEAASLHAQLEDAFDEIAGLQQERDAATAKLAAVEESQIAEGEATERNTALLKAATAEIERLQRSIAATETEAEAEAKERQALIATLETERDEALAAQDDLARQIGSLSADLDLAKAEAGQAQQIGLIEDPDATASFDAAVQAQSIAAGLKEADLLAEIEELRSALGADRAESEIDDDPAEATVEVIALRERVALAEAELEQLLLAGLKLGDETSSSSARPSPAAADSAEAERLRAELLTAQADIIKLNADVKAAKQRLAERDISDNGSASRPDNSEKLEQQLASTRSRVQQLNKALADAKLREVAIDLALINVVPAPSPPAPR